MAVALKPYNFKIFQNIFSAHYILYLKNALQIAGKICSHIEVKCIAKIWLLISLQS